MSARRARLAGEQPVERPGDGLSEILRWLMAQPPPLVEEHRHTTSRHPVAKLSAHAEVEILLPDHDVGGYPTVRVRIPYAPETRPGRYLSLEVEERRDGPGGKRDVGKTVPRYFVAVSPACGT